MPICVGWEEVDFLFLIFFPFPVKPCLVMKNLEVYAMDCCLEIMVSFFFLEIKLSCCWDSSVLSISSFLLLGQLCSFNFFFFLVRMISYFVPNRCINKSLIILMFGALKILVCNPIKPYLLLLN